MAVRARTALIYDFDGWGEVKRLACEQDGLRALPLRSTSRLRGRFTKTLGRQERECSVGRTSCNRARSTNRTRS